MWLAVLFGTFLTWIFCFIWTNTRDDWILRKEMNEEREKRKLEESEISAADKALQAVANMVENALEWTIQGVGNISAIDSSDSTERASCGCLSKNKAKLPYDVDKVRRVVDLSRPMPTREDTVAILKNGHVKLAYVINIDHGLRTSPEYANLVGSLLTTELIPSGVKTKRCIEEAFVIDRGFSLGETVVLYQNEFPDDAKKAIERTTKKGMIGQVINAKVTSDLLVLPGKTYVARNIDLGKVETLDMVNFNSAHNYVLYDDWIGDLVNITNDITMIYNGHRLTARDNGSLALIRKDRSDEQKSCIPGEVVQMLVSDVLSSHVKWEKEMPFKLRRLSRKKSAFYGDDSITCLVEKVEPVTVEVRWLMSPSSVEHPPKNIEKSDFNKFTKVDLSANLRIAADDRVRVKTTDEDEAITLTEYNKYLDDQYGNKFEQKVKPGNASVALKSSTSSIVKAVHKAASPPGDEGAPPEKNAKVGSSAEILTLNTEKMEPITEHDDETMQVGETTTDCDDQDPNRTDGQRGLVRKGHRPRMKRTRVKRIRRNQASTQTNKTTSRQAKELFGAEFIGEVLRTQTTVDVEWMDGTISYDLPGNMLVPVDPDLDQQDHLPGVLVARKDGNTSDELGLILQTDQQERCALVRWLQIAGDGVPADKGEEQCTLFEIMPHPLYQRMMVGAIGVEIGKEAQKLSDVVFQVKSHLKNGQSEVEYYNGTRATLWPTEMTLLFVPEDDDATQSSDEETDNDESWNNWSSQQEEDLTVDQPSTSSANVTFSNFIAKGAKLLFGKESFFKYVLPGPKLSYSDRYVQELISQGKNPTNKEVAERARLSSMANPRSDEVILVQSMEEIAEANHQARQIEQYIVGTEAVLSKSTTQDLSPEFFGKIIRSPPSTRREGLLAHYEPADVDAILAMIDVVPHLNESCLKKDYFYKWLCVVLHAESAIHREYMDELYAKLDLVKEGLQKLEQTSDRNAAGLESSESTSSELPTDSSKKGTILTLPTCSSHNWKNFEMNAPGKVWMRRIMSELKTIREHLPEGIHVIIYEDRVDLLSTVIVGPRGTPYEATPFYFDIRFKSDYPTGPPEVHYHAFSQEQLNPNLYQNGRVCTSLLGTWQGKGVETWNSTSSNLLQVLLSIQALILVPEPFFNEAGYESRKNTPGMNENSQRYNETAMINSLQYLESIAKHPPGGSMPIVMDELKTQWPILKAEMSSWLEERTTPDFPVQMSKGFRISLERMITRISALNLQ